MPLHHMGITPITFSNGLTPTHLFDLDVLVNPNIHKYDEKTLISPDALFQDTIEAIRGIHSAGQRVTFLSQELPVGLITALPNDLKLLVDTEYLVIKDDTFINLGRKELDQHRQLLTYTSDRMDNLEQARRSGWVPYRIILDRNSKSSLKPVSEMMKTDKGLVYANSPSEVPYSSFATR